MNDGHKIFDRRAVRAHRDRAARAPEGHDFLHREVAARLVERLGEIRRDFACVLELGCHRGALSVLLTRRGDVETLVASDLSPACAGHARDVAPLAMTLAGDEEALPIATGGFDLVISCLALHWVNDLPGALIQARRALKPDGLFLAALFGGTTLGQLRQAMMKAEIEVEGGASPRISPFVDIRDAGALLQRAGFALPVVDRDEITVAYENPLALMKDLRLMGEANAMRERRVGFSRRETLLRAAAIYEGTSKGADGRVPASFEIIYLTGWAPDPSQPKALRPGSAQTHLADALGSEESESNE
ncbi:MAG: methyltransferase domain-containing protein [Alphaproteobacteria bacterium]|nr:methyltransferase domain-containing protein [Alphaproteobacteria bacterium]